MYNEEKIIAASGDLEALLAVGKQVVLDMREQQNPYARVYWLRRELSRIVATLGAGAPNLSSVDHEYGALLRMERGL